VIAAIKGRLAAATPGEWEWDTGAESWQRYRLRSVVGCSEVIVPGYDGEGTESMTISEGDADLIANAPTDLQHLLSLVEQHEREAEIARLKPKAKPALPLLSLPIVSGHVWARVAGGVIHHAFSRATWWTALCGASTGDARIAVVKGSRVCPKCLTLATETPR